MISSFMLKYRFVSSNTSDTNIFTIDIVLDPLSKESQIIAPILDSLSYIEGVGIRLYLNPSVENLELPKTFYRAVIATSPKFEE